MWNITEHPRYAGFDQIIRDAAAKLAAEDREQTPEMATRVNYAIGQCRIARLIQLEVAEADDWDVSEYWDLLDSLTNTEYAEYWRRSQVHRP